MAAVAFCVLFFVTVMGAGVGAIALKEPKIFGGVVSLRRRIVSISIYVLLICVLVLASSFRYRHLVLIVMFTILAINTIYIDHLAKTAGPSRRLSKKQIIFQIFLCSLLAIGAIVLFFG